MHQDPKIPSLTLEEKSLSIDKIQKKSDRKIVVPSINKQLGGLIDRRMYLSTYEPIIE